MKNKPPRITREEVEAVLNMNMPLPKDLICRCVDYDYLHTRGWHEAMAKSQTVK